MNSEMNYEYQFPFENLAGDSYLVKVGTHCRNSVGEPRIKWRTEMGAVAGKWGLIKLPQDHSRAMDTPFLTMEVSEPTLVFGRFGDARPTIFDMARDSLPVPDRVGAALRDELEALGSCRISESVSSNPSDFPPVISDPGLPLEPAKWSRVGWDPDQQIMWYKLTNWPDLGTVEWEHEAVTSPRPYQIENGNLVWRKHHIIGARGSAEDLVEELGLERVV